jgi:hypothetical protein
MCSLTNSTMFSDVTFYNGIASTHFVKYSVAKSTNLCPLLDGGFIWPIKSIPHPLNGHGLIIGFRADAGTL